MRDVDEVAEILQDAMDEIADSDSRNVWTPGIYGPCRADPDEHLRRMPPFWEPLVEPESADSLLILCDSEHDPSGATVTLDCALEYLDFLDTDPRSVYATIWHWLRVMRNLHGGNWGKP